VSTAEEVVSYPYWFHEEVVVLRWPEQQKEAERCSALSVPRLLLVAADASPPPTVHCLEDWLRLPADERDVRARLAALVHRAREHPATPTLDSYGQLSFRGERVFLSPTDERIARLLIDAFDEPVAESELLAAVRADGGQAAKLRVHISRLRKRIAPLGLGIKAIRNVGYRLHGPAPKRRQQHVR
jgi:hypothetical protein